MTKQLIFYIALIIIGSILLGNNLHFFAHNNIDKFKYNNLGVKLDYDGDGAKCDDAVKIYLEDYYGLAKKYISQKSGEIFAIKPEFDYVEWNDLERGDIIYSNSYNMLHVSIFWNYYNEEKIKVLDQNSGGRIELGYSIINKHDFAWGIRIKK